MWKLFLAGLATVAIPVSCLTAAALTTPLPGHDTTPKQDCDSFRSPLDRISFSELSPPDGVISSTPASIRVLASYTLDSHGTGTIELELSSASSSRIDTSLRYSREGQPPVVEKGSGTRVLTITLSEARADKITVIGKMVPTGEALLIAESTCADPVLAVTFATYVVREPSDR